MSRSSRIVSFLRSTRGRLAVGLLLLFAVPAGLLIHHTLVAYAQKIDFDRWTLDSHFEPPYPNPVPHMQKPILAALGCYERLLYKGPGQGSVASIEAAVILGAPNYVDVICRQDRTPPNERAYLFRISRSPLKKSGFLKIDAQRCTGTWLTSDLFSRDTVKPPLSAASFHEHANSFRFYRNLGTAGDPTDAKIYTVKITFDKDKITAFVNGTLYGSFEDISGLPVPSMQTGTQTGDPIGTGRVGIQSGNYPPVLLQKVTITAAGPTGELTLTDEFRPAIAQTGWAILIVAATIVVSLAGWILYSLLVTAVLARDLGSILFYDSATFILVPPLGWLASSLLPMGVWGLVVPLAVPIMLKVGYLVRNRKDLRYCLAPPTPPHNVLGPIPRAAMFGCIAWAIASVALVVVMTATGRLPAGKNEVAVLSREVASWSWPDAPTSFHPEGRVTADATITASVTLNPQTVLEIFFRKHIRYRQHEWYAFVASTTGPCGFRKSSGPDEIHGSGVRLSPAEAHEIALNIRGDRFTAFVDAKPAAEWSDRDYAAGECGFVIRDGKAAVHGFTVTPADPRLSAGRLLLIRGGRLVLKLIALPVIWLLYCYLVAAIARLPLGHLLRCDLPTYVPLLLYAVPTVAGIRLDLALGTDASILRLFAVAAVIVLKMLYLAVNREACRRYGWLMLAGFAALLADAEWNLRTSSMANNFRLFPAEPGYIKNQFIYAHKDFNNLWQSYLRDPAFISGSHAPEKPPGTYRIVLLGGSTSYGHGVSDPGYAYPAILERLLNDATGIRPRVEILNASYPGYTTEDALAQYRRDLDRYEFDMIVVRLIVNDVFPRPWPMPLNELAPLLRDRSRLSTTQKIVDYSHLLGLSAQTVARARYELLPGANRSPVGPDRFVENMKSFIRIAAERKVPLIIVDEPFSDIECFEGGMGREYHDRCRSLAREQRMEFVELTNAVFAERRNDQIFCDPVHTTRRGNDLIARAIEEAVLARLPQGHPRPGP